MKASRERSEKLSRKIIYKIVVDCMMTVLLLLLMAYSLIGEALHEWIGVGMLILFILHHVLNASWYKNLMKGRYSPYRILQTFLAFLIFFTMIGSMVSGIVMSNYVYDFLPVSGGQALAQSLHLPCAYWGFLLMSIHLGLHWGMMMNVMNRMTGLRQSHFRTIVLRVLAVLFAAYGLLAFFSNDLPSYLLMRTHFVFLDFEQPLILFFLDYLAIMGLFVWVGYYGGKGLLAWNKRRR